MLRTSESGSGGGNISRTYLQIVSCTLKSFDALDACVAVGTDVSPTTTGGASSVCEGTEDWFDACETVEDPVCPANSGPRPGGLSLLIQRLDRPPRAK